jgi:phage gp46-like protein
LGEDHKAVIRRYLETNLLVAEVAEEPALQPLVQEATADQVAVAAALLQHLG